MIDSLRFFDIRLRQESAKRIAHLATDLYKFQKNEEKYKDIYSHVPDEFVRRLLTLIHGIVLEHFLRVNCFFPDINRVTQYWKANSKGVEAAIASIRELQNLLPGSGLSIAIPSQWEAVFSGCDEGRRAYLVPVNIDSEKTKPIFTLMREVEAVVGNEVIVTETAWLSSGSFANVYQFTNPLDNEVYALKVAKDDINTQDLAAFEMEYEILSSIDSAHVVRAFNYFHDMNAFTMELMDRTLEDYWQLGHDYPEDIESRLEILEQIVFGVEDINSQGVWHRDLSPNNILLKVDGGHVIAKLADFGISRRMSDRNSEDEEVVGFFNDRDDLKRVGFAHYGLPHEIYSLTLLSLYVLMRIRFTDHGGTNDKRKHYEGVLGTIVSKGLNENPNARYESIQCLWKDLQTLTEYYC